MNTIKKLRKWSLFLIALIVLVFIVFQCHTHGPKWVFIPPGGTGGGKGDPVNNTCQEYGACPNSGEVVGYCLKGSDGKYIVVKPADPTVIATCAYMDKVVPNVCHTDNRPCASYGGGGPVGSFDIASSGDTASNHTDLAAQGNTLLGVTPDPVAGSLDRKASLRFVFSQSIDPATLRFAGTLVPYLSGSLFLEQTDLFNDTVVITPGSFWPNGSGWSLTISENDINGGAGKGTINNGSFIPIVVGNVDYEQGNCFWAHCGGVGNTPTPCAAGGYVDGPILSSSNNWDCTCMTRQCWAP